ncbi:MAG: Mlc titration factor MtfA (ptsG expression regulator) [Bacteroidia bacterium]|jgi:Mlc titration factor MtfA (ptsG expression regulator)
MKFILILVVALLLYAFVLRPARKRARRTQLRAQPFPSAWSEVLKQSVPVFEHLPADLQSQLQGHIQVFLGEKRFIGCDGLEVSDEMRVTVAAQACLLLLNRETSIYGGLSTIYLYPSAYVATTRTQGGAGAEQVSRSVRLGESWTRGSVVLSWSHSRSGAANFDDGSNVVLHEFAHQLDQEDGDADGAPQLKTPSCYRTWAAVLGSEFKRVQGRRAGRNFKSLINDYGATNPAEFFAVATENFFEKPIQLKRKHSELYGELAKYYQVNPGDWKR